MGTVQIRSNRFCPFGQDHPSRRNINEKNKDDKKMLQKVIDLNDPETSIIDINKGEKIITE